MAGSATTRPYTSGSSADTATWASSLATWVQVIGAGTTIVVDDTDYSLTITTDAAEPAACIPGKFKAFTSTTATRVRMGNGLIPRLIIPSNATINGATVPAAGALTPGNVLQVTDVDALGYAPVNLSGGANYVTGHQSMYSTAATVTASFTAAIDTLWYLNTLNTAAVATLPLIDTTNDGHVVAMFNAGTTAGVWTPASGDCVGGTAASNATLAGPAAGVMQTLVAILAARRWVPHH